MEEFALEGQEWVELKNLLKLVGLCETGGFYSPLTRYAMELRRPGVMPGKVDLTILSKGP